MKIVRQLNISLCICMASVCNAVAADAAEKKTRPRDNVRVSPARDKIIDGALAYLADKQIKDGDRKGSWGISSRERQHSVAITGYTLIAFQAAGNLPNEGKYGENVKAGMEFLLKGERGYFLNPSNGQYMYEHGIATIALGELYGKTRSKKIREKLESAVKVIIQAQNSQEGSHHYGGWRYRPRVGDADISVTVLQVVALRAAKNAGINVPKQTIDRAVSYVKACRNSDGGFGYQPRSGSGFARTAAAIYSLQVCGKYDDRDVEKGSDYLMNALRTKGSSQQWYVYGSFYAAPAQYMRGGKRWEDWYKVAGDLADSEKIKMDQGGKTMYRWEAKGGNNVGPIYTTAVYTTLLAMPYSYIPLYQR